MRMIKVFTLTTMVTGMLSVSASAQVGTVFSAPSTSTGLNPAYNSMDIPRPDRSYMTGVSDTSAFYYKVGVKRFERGDFAKAEIAFNAVLRAKGSKKNAHHYLALIHEKKGDLAAAARHAQAYQTAR